MSYNNIIPASLYMQIVEETIKNKCRICKHSIYDHATCKRKGKKPCLWIKDLSNPKPNFDCKCTNFETSDNLEYLEQKYDQLGKNTRRKSSKNK